MKYFPHGPAHFPNNVVTLAYQTHFNKVCLDTRLKLTGLFKLWIALHSSLHSVMSQPFRSSSSIFHRHVAKAFAPEFPILFKLKLSFFICTKRWKTEVAFALNIEANNKVDWPVMEFALSIFLNILTASSKLTQPTTASLVEKKKHFYDHSKHNYYSLVTAKRIKFNCHNCVCIRFQYLVAVSIVSPTQWVKHVDTFAEANLRWFLI